MESARAVEPGRLCGGGAVSRFLFLNPSFIFATYPPASGGPPSSAGIFGLASRSAVPARASLRHVVGSCPTFSPLPGTGGCFLLRPPQGCPCLRFPQCDALPCPDFPQHCCRDGLSHRGAKV